jgi:anti-sigma-K factor RskA
MSPNTEQLIEFERHARTVLEESVRRIDGRVRSRLNQARQAAVAEATRRRLGFWRSFSLMPTAGAVAAALLVAMVIWHRQPQSELPTIEGAHSTVEDLDLLADGEGLDLMEGGDGSFYEWAVEQPDLNGETDG